MYILQTDAGILYQTVLPLHLESYFLIQHPPGHEVLLRGTENGLTHFCTIQLPLKMLFTIMCFHSITGEISVLHKAGHRHIP